MSNFQQSGKSYCRQSGYPLSTTFTNKVNGYQAKVDGSKSKFLQNKDLSPDLDFTTQHCCIPPKSNLNTPGGYEVPL